VCSRGSLAFRAKRSPQRELRRCCLTTWRLAWPCAGGADGHFVSAQAAALGQPHASVVPSHSCVTAPGRACSQVTFEPVPTGEQLRAPNADGAPRGSAANPFAPMTVRGALDLHGTARPIRLAAPKLLRARTACAQGNVVLWRSLAGWRPADMCSVGYAATQPCRTLKYVTGSGRLLTVLVQVSASIAEEGLGLAMWWEQPADGADDMEDA